MVREVGGINPEKAPLWEALRRHVGRGYTGFHFPGHGGGRGLGRALRAAAGALARYDLTELPGLDDLHAPAGPIAAAQALAARLYGADRSFFLVNGSTVGVQAMMAAALREGDRVILPRNIHRSVAAGLVLTGASPVYITPPVDPDFGVHLGVRPGDLAAAVRRHPEARAFLPVHPSYYGASGLNPRHVSLLREAGMLLLVDEAHGAHLPFHPALPAPALELGADAVVQSMHKMGAGFTQTALLHLRGGGLDAGAVGRVLGMLQSSSPSYLLMASLDLARRELACRGAQVVGRMAELGVQLRRGLAAAGFPVFAGPDGQDPAKVLFGVRATGMDGRRAARLLSGPEHRIQVELAGPGHLLAVIGPGCRGWEVRRLLAAVRKLPRPRRTPGRKPAAGPPPAVTAALTPRQAFLAAQTTVRLRAAAGRTVAETVTVSPPGIPVLIMGEKISPEVLEYIQEVRSRGQFLTTHDPTGETLRVVAEG